MKNNNISSFLVNPFTRIAGWQAFAIGIIIVAITVLFGYNFNISFPGAIDIKYTPELLLGNAFIFQAIGLFSTILVLYIAALIFAKYTRFQDIVGTTTLARFPYFFAPPLGLLFNNELITQIMENPFQMPVFSTSDIVLLVISALLMTVIIIWYVVVLYNAFKVSTDLKGNKCIGIFIGCILLSEIISVGIIFLFIL